MLGPLHKDSPSSSSRRGCAPANTKAATASLTPAASFATSSVVKRQAVRNTVRRVLFHSLFRDEESRLFLWEIERLADDEIREIHTVNSLGVLFRQAHLHRSMIKSKPCTLLAELGRNDRASPGGLRAATRRELPAVDNRHSRERHRDVA